MVDVSRSAVSAWDAMCRSQAVIEFDLSGTILWANDLFLAAVGYRLDEIVGRHHRMFCIPDDVVSPAYGLFWKKLGRGEFEVGRFRRVAKTGDDIWFQATYNPVFDDDGRPVRVLKFACDVSAETRRSAEDEGKLAAIARSLAMVEFGVDGEIIDANENFLTTMDYRLADVVGRHHRIFCDAAHARSVEYQDFWEKLARGDFAAVSTGG